MKLGLVMLDPSSSLNGLDYLREVYVNPGDTAVVVFQLIDLDTINQNDLIGTRYMPASGATMQATIVSVNDANTITLSPAMVFPNDDRSIWSFSLNSAQTVMAAGVNLNIVLTEGTKITSAIGKNVLFINPPSNYQC